MATEALIWTFNPWRAEWWRPASALLGCIAVAMVFGYTVSVPNYSQDWLDQVKKEARLPAEHSGTYYYPPSGFTLIEDIDEALADGMITETEAQHIREARELLEQIDRHQRAWRGQWLAWSGISLLFLLGMTLVIFTPVGYKLDERGVTVRFMGVNSFRPWEHYRNFYAHKRVVHLTTMPKPSRLDPFRGHPLQFAGNRDAVLAYLGEHIVKAGQDSSGA